MGQLSLWQAAVSPRLVDVGLLGIRLLLSVALLAGCSSAGEVAPSSTPATASPLAFDPAAGATVLLPENGPATIPVVVLVPGGSWKSADPSGMESLAQALVDNDSAAVLTTYRTASDDSYFPTPVEDVACSVAYAVDAVRARGMTPGRVVILGHSAGAQLAALVALRPEEFAGSCAFPLVVPDALVGLAGPYDVSTGGFGSPLFGPDRPDPAEWGPGNPILAADHRPQLDVLLVHGRADNVVPVDFTERFAEALRRGGHQVSVELLEGIDHGLVYSAEVATPIITRWLDTSS